MSYPAYNAERTLEKTFMALEKTVVDDVILVDDSSTETSYAIRIGRRSIDRDEADYLFG